MKKVDVSLSCRLLMTPIKLVKIQQQKQQQQRTPACGVTGRRRQCSSNGQTLSARAIAQQVYRAGGIRGLYHGLSAMLLHDVGGYGLYFSGVRSVSLPFPAHKYSPQKSMKEHCAFSCLLIPRTTQAQRWSWMNWPTRSRARTPARGHRSSSHAGQQGSSAG